MANPSLASNPMFSATGPSPQDRAERDGGVGYAAMSQQGGPFGAPSMNGPQGGYPMAPTQAGAPQQAYPVQGSPSAGAPQQAGMPGSYGSSPMPGQPDPLEQQFGMPAATGDDRGLMTVENTVTKIAVLFGITLALGVVGWFVPLLAPVGAIGTLVLGLIIAFKKQVSVPLILVYAVLEGLFVGGISRIIESVAPGAVIQALLATACVSIAVIALTAMGKLRTTKKLNAVFLVATIGLILFSLVNVVVMVAAPEAGMFGVRSMHIGNTGIPWGLPLGLLAILLAAYSMVSDVEFIKNGERNRIPEKYGWFGAYGLLVSVVWMYVEILRLIAIFRE